MTQTDSKDLRKAIEEMRKNETLPGMKVNLLIAEILLDLNDKISLIQEQTAGVKRRLTDMELRLQEGLKLIRKPQ